MNKYIFSFLITAFSLGTLWGQNYELPPAKQQQFESLRIAFLTKRLSLNSAEAKVFWPVYDAYREELTSIYKKRQRIERRIKLDFDDMSESEMEKLSDDYMALQKDEYEARAKYHEEFKAILSARKVILLYKAESDLNREMLKRIRESRQSQRN
ncbi:MAG: hypothetical protein AAF927_20120 [Bacteroidota bacterium]